VPVLQLLKCGFELLCSSVDDVSAVLGISLPGRSDDKIMKGLKELDVDHPGFQS
jgi:hypothetical protein